MNRSKTTELVMPILSAGRHRNPRHGACFMEFASYLAGERWSDHPACTHPALAALARNVNDLSSDRAALVEHIPRVVGLSSSDPLVASRLAVLAACAALPVVSMERQQALAVGLRRIGSLSPDLDARVSSALASAPGAARWADDYVRAHPAVPFRRGERAAQAEAMVRTATVGIHRACLPDDDIGADARLAALLAAAIGDLEQQATSSVTAAPADLVTA